MRVKEIRKTLKRNQDRTKKLMAELNKALSKEQASAAVLHAALVVAG